MPIPFLLLFQSVPAVTAIQSIPPAPPAPPLPPALYRASPYYARPDRPVQRYTVEVEVRADDIDLWKGSLRVATGFTSRMTRSQVEAPPAQCEAATWRSEGSSLTFSVSPSFGLGAGEGMTRVSLRWTRPAGEGCAEGLGGRTVELNQEVLLEPGRSVTLRGDAGLTMTLRRR